MSEPPRAICPTCRSSGFLPSKLGPDRCEFCDGTFSGNPPGPDESGETELERRLQMQTVEAADLQEAGSIRYAVGLRLAKLTSGNWAIWAQGLEGLEFVQADELLPRLLALGEVEFHERLRFWEEAERRLAAGWDEPVVVGKASKTLEDMGL